MSALVDKAKRWEGKHDEERKEREQLKMITRKGHGSKERKEKIEATAKTTDRPPLYPYKGGKKKKKGQYSKALVNPRNYMTITPTPSPGVISS